jgi:hypothetical protein
MSEAAPEAAFFNSHPLVVSQQIGSAILGIGLRPLACRKVVGHEGGLIGPAETCLILWSETRTFPGLI